MASHWAHTDHDQAWTASAGVAYQWGQTQFSTDATYGSGIGVGAPQYGPRRGLFIGVGKVF